VVRASWSPGFRASWFLIDGIWQRKVSAATRIASPRMLAARLVADDRDKRRRLSSALTGGQHVDLQAVYMHIQVRIPLADQEFGRREETEWRI
jgi:hypothetical protein